MSRKESTTTNPTMTKLSRRDTTLSGESRYETADESTADDDQNQNQNLRKKMHRTMSRKSSIARLVRQASAASINVYNNIFGGTHYAERRRRRSSVRRKYGVDRQLIELVRGHVLKAVEEEERKFHEKKSTNNENDSPFHVKDVNYIRETDDMITRFLLEYFEDHPYDDSKCDEETIASTVSSHVLDTLKWRKEMNVNEMKDSDFPHEFYKSGIFAFGHDSDGRQVLYLKGKKCKKTTNNWIPMVIAFLTHEAEKKMVEIFGDPMNPKNPPLKPGVVCDCSGVSVANVDISLAFSLIPLIKYYPQSFEYVWVYELPWMVRPFFTMILKVLPNRIVGKVKQMDRKSAINEMGPEGIPKFMGGKGPDPVMEVPSNASNIRDVGIKRGIPESDIKKMVAYMKDITDEK